MKKIFITLFLFICISANAVEKKTNFSEKVFTDAINSGKTVVVYKGNNEVARVVGQTDKKIIYAAIIKGI